MVYWSESSGNDHIVVSYVSKATTTKKHKENMAEYKIYVYG